MAAQIVHITSLWGTGDRSAVIYPGASEHRAWSSTPRASPGVCLGHTGPRRCLDWRHKVCGLGIEAYNQTLVELVILWPLERGVPSSPVGELDFNNLLTLSHLTLKVDSRDCVRKGMAASKPPANSLRVRPRWPRDHLSEVQHHSNPPAASCLHCVVDSHPELDG